MSFGTIEGMDQRSTAPSPTGSQEAFDFPGEGPSTEERPRDPGAFRRLADEGWDGLFKAVDLCDAMPVRIADLKWHLTHV